MANPNDLMNRIHELERQVKALEEKLSEYTNIEGYYLEKYQEIFAEIRKSRDEEIKQELENMAVEISVLKQEKEDKTKALESKVEIDKKLKEIEIHLSELYHQTEVITLDSESEITELEQIGLQMLEQHKEQVHKFVRKIYKLMVPPYNTENILFLKDAIINYLRGEGFDSVKTKKENHRKSLDIKKNYEKNNKEFQETIVQLKLDRESLLANAREIENIDINHIQDEITRFTIHHENYLREMMASLDQIKEDHESIIVDKVKKLSILGYTKKEIGEILDDQLVVFSQELLTVDSVENKTYQKEKRLKKLEAEAEKLKVLDIEKETVNAEYKELQTRYLAMQKQVQTIEDFNAKVHDIIDNNNQYHNFAENYISFMNFEKEVKGMRQAKVEEYNSLDDSIETLETKKALKAEIDGLDRSLEEANMKISEFKQNPENEKVLKMLLSVIEYETNLPLIYDTLNKLKKQIDEKYERLTYLKEQLIEYQSILMQIEGLTDEN
ncbi:MAG: hypothetical protein IJX78_01680 [Bacilli bacterium]|nr:hypothetical protein [Bacilli bacterium]